MGVEDADFQKKLDTTDQQGRVDFAGDHIGDGGGGHSSDDPPRERLGQALPSLAKPRPYFAEPWPSFGKLWLNLAKLGQALAKLPWSSILPLPLP